MMGGESTNANTAVAPDGRLRSATTWDELAALPGFRSEQVLVDDMRRGNVVGQYSMKGSEMRSCGTASCSQSHKHGFIVELVDGTLSHVERICGKTKLGVEFNKMLVRFRATRKAAAKAQAATAVRDEARAAITGKRCQGQLFRIDHVPRCRCPILLTMRTTGGEAAQATAPGPLCWVRCCTSELNYRGL